MITLENFSGAFGDLPANFLTRLDRVLARLAQGMVVASTTINYTFKSSDQIASLYVDSTSGNITVLLPSSPTGEQRRTITKKVAANVVIVDGNGAKIYSSNVPAGASQTWLNGQYESITLEPNGTAWVVVACVP